MKIKTKIVKGKGRVIICDCCVKEAYLFKVGGGMGMGHYPNRDYLIKCFNCGVGIFKTEEDYNKFFEKTMKKKNIERLLASKRFAEKENKLLLYVIDNPKRENSIYNSMSKKEVFGMKIKVDNELEKGSIELRDDYGDKVLIKNLKKKNNLYRLIKYLFRIK